MTSVTSVVWKSCPGEELVDEVDWRQSPLIHSFHTHLKSHTFSSKRRRSAASVLTGAWPPYSHTIGVGARGIGGV